MNRIDEIDTFLEKATILEQTIKGLSDGSLKSDTISLKEYGILTPEETAQEEARQKIVRQKRARKKDEKIAAEKERERSKWWDGAVYTFGPREGSLAEREIIVEERKKQEHSNEAKRQTHKEKLSHKYSSDYSRWADGIYVPDDRATKDEQIEEEKKQEEKHNETFENANKEWCDTIKADVMERQEITAKQEASAVQLRLKGNLLMKKKSYTEAVSRYTQALEKTPYEVLLLTNISIAFGKIGSWQDSLEFCNRTIHLDKSHTKVLYHRCKAYTSLNLLDKALIDINRCVELDPGQSIFLKHRLELNQKIETEDLEKILFDASKVIVGTDNFENERTKLMDKSVLNNCSLSIENLMIAVTIQRDNTNFIHMVKKQCHIIDQCMTLYKEIGQTKVIRNEHQRMCMLFCGKIRTCAIASVYMRLSGHLKDTVDNLVRYFREFERGLSQNIAIDTTDKIPAKEGINQVTELIIEVVRKDPPSYKVVHEVSARGERKLNHNQKACSSVRRVATIVPHVTNIDFSYLNVCHISERCAYNSNFVGIFDLRRGGGYIRKYRLFDIGTLSHCCFYERKCSHS